MHSTADSQPLLSPNALHAEWVACLGRNKR
jgi:hypothetical protein